MRKTAFAYAGAFLLLLAVAIPGAGAKVTVASVSHSPLEPTPDDEVTVTLELTNSSDVEKTVISWCQSNPEMCFTPREMKYIGADTFALSIGKFPDGQGIKYNITVVLLDGNKTVTPDQHFTVHEKAPNGNGGNNNTTNNHTDGNGTNGAKGLGGYLLYGIIGVVVLVAIAAAAVALRRKKPKAE